MLIDDITSSGAIPTLEASLRFAAERQRLIAGNIANISTPDYRQKDVSIAGFQEALGRAIDARRASTGGERGDLPFRSTQELRVDGAGSADFHLAPKTPSGTTTRQFAPTRRSVTFSVTRTQVSRTATSSLAASFHAFVFAPASREQWARVSRAR